MTKDKDKEGAVRKLSDASEQYQVERLLEIPIGATGNAEELDNLTNEWLDAVGGLTRNLFSKKDVDKAQNVILAGDKHIAKTDRAVKSMETQMISLFERMDSVQVHAAHLGALRQQIDATMEQLP